VTAIGVPFVEILDRAEGAPKKRSAMYPACAESSGKATTRTEGGSCGALTPGAGSHSTARAPASTAACAKSSP